FDAGQESARAQVRRYIESFRYVVVALDFTDMELASRALGGLFQLEVVADEEQLREREATGHVGLLLLGEPGGVAEGVARLRRVTAAAIERQPPLIYCGRESSQ